MALLPRTLALLCRAPLRSPLKSSASHPLPSRPIPLPPPQSYKGPCLPSPSPFPSNPSSTMPSSPLYRRDHEYDALAIALAASDMSLRDQSPLFTFDDSPHFDPAMSDSDQLIFDFEDSTQIKSPFAWNPPSDFNMSSIVPFPGSPDSTTSQLDATTAHLSLNDSPYSPAHALSSHNELPATPDYNDSALFSHWLNDPEPPSLYSSPIPIPMNPSAQHQHQPSSGLSSFIPGSHDSTIFPDVSFFSPTTAYAALQPLPRSFSPAEAEDTIMTEALRGDAAPASFADATLKPAWASQLWDPSSTQNAAASGAPGPIPPLSEDAYATQRPRPRVSSRSQRSFTPVAQIFQSSSAPSVSHVRPPPLARSYSRRAESTSEYDDYDATIRKKKKSLTEIEDARPVEKRAESPPLKSLLRPPKLAPSAWQLYFTDWITRHQASSNKKLNVAQAAKEAGQEYAKLSSEEKEPYKRRSQALKEERERELAAYMRTLTPDDIKRENAFRTAQRRAGKSRKGNIKDPNAPKKPLSAYFMFLQRIRSDPELVKEVFADETETTKQSVLAAHKWRSMTDDERKPFLAQAEQEKLEYEAARKMYEEGTVGYGSSINFSILPGSPINSMPFPRSSSLLRPLKQEGVSSESESDGFATDDGADVKRG
ncbi:hypothetical protein OBBRIDRAFT_787855 [Obba rivulosa]|uniref:HMG box domain-containing protein n=1 Tax=Obba rivulosa TaxID=1052685 RepID=A0A8E2DU43_9APHY|nr:hypothetical protein OBBRIDRAFT_787855 [Obba rivulosa]